MHHFRGFCELNLPSRRANRKSVRNASSWVLSDRLSTCSSRRQIWFAKTLKMVRQSWTCFHEGDIVEFCAQKRGSVIPKMLNFVHRSLDRKTCQPSLGRKWCSWACINSFCPDSTKVIILKFLEFSENGPKSCDFPSVIQKSAHK